MLKVLTGKKSFVSYFTEVIFLFIILCIFFLLFPKSVSADLKSRSQYDVHVKMDKDGSAVVEYRILLENRSSKFYIRSYSLSTGQEKVSNIKVTENGEKSKFTKKKINDEVRIDIDFKKDLIYQGDKVNLTVKYQSKDILFDEGILKKLYVPPINTEETLEKANFKVSYPSSLGEHDYISLRNIPINKSNGRLVISYRQDIAPSGLLLIWGKRQIYEFNFEYSLVNDSEKKKIYTVTLPPEGIDQAVRFLEVDKVPSKTFTDADGNNIIEYYLDPHEDKKIKIFGTAEYRINNINDYELPPDDVNVYTQDTERWNYRDNVNASIISSIVKQHFNQIENIRNIYNYIVENKDDIIRNGKENRDNELFEYYPTSYQCDKITQAFVTLARGAGIPSREVVGITPMREDLSTLHWWVEYYNYEGKGWVPLDPCIEAYMKYNGFENFNPNRIILAYRGVSDNLPDVIIPFQDNQGLGYENLIIKPSNQEIVEASEELIIDYEVGYPDILMKSVPLSLIVKNNTYEVFKIGKVLIGDIEVSILDTKERPLYYEAVFPNQEAHIELDFQNISNFSVEKIENYILRIKGFYGENYVDEKFDIQINKPVSKYHVFSWIISSILSLVSMTIVLLVYRKLLYNKKSKYIPEHKFKKSKMIDILDED